MAQTKQQTKWTIPPMDLEESVQKCFKCGAEVNAIIGTPDGSELCFDCFNQGVN